MIWSLASSSKRRVGVHNPQGSLALNARFLWTVLVVEGVRLGTLTSYCLSWIESKILFMKRASCSFRRKLTTIMSFHKIFLFVINFSWILIIVSVLAVDPF